MKRSLLCLTLVIGLAGCGGGGGSAATSDEVGKTIAQAENEVMLAKKADSLWLNTEKELDAAKKAQKAGDNDKAMKYAKKVIKEAQAAQKQAADNANPHPTW